MGRDGAHSEAAPHLKVVGADGMGEKEAAKHGTDDDLIDCVVGMAEEGQHTNIAHAYIHNLKARPGSPAVRAADNTCLSFACSHARDLAWLMLLPCLLRPMLSATAALSPVHFAGGHCARHLQRAG